MHSAVHSRAIARTTTTAILVAVFLLSVLVGQALANSKDTGYLVFQNDGVSWCGKGRALLRHPANNPNYIMDYNSYIQGWNGQCTAVKSFGAGEGGVMALLYGPGGVCRSFGWNYNSSTTNTFGVGAPANAWCGQGNYKVMGFQHLNPPGISWSGNFTTANHWF